MPRLLHGILTVNIYGIDNLRLGSCFNSWQKVFSSSGRKSIISQVKRIIGLDPQIEGFYATVDLDRARVARTSILDMERFNLLWDESFYIYTAHYISEIIFTIKGHTRVGGVLIGRAHVPVEDVVKGLIVEEWIDIVINEGGVRIRGSPRIHVKMQFSDVTKDDNWSKGIQNPGLVGVPNAFFLQRSGCKVILYQDAHVGNDFRPKITLSDGSRYEPRRCWEDIVGAITNARHLIYIAGWSVNAGITLVRDPRLLKAGGDHRLGEILKKKAEDPGMAVLLLVWDDQTSKGIKKDGLMATHDQATLDYFRGSNVRCFLCPRTRDGGKSVAQGLTSDIIFTHHQKLIVVDADSDGQSDKRRIVSFIGGIDLCVGRYDTPDHPLFKTLDLVHRDDFHQPNFPEASIKKGGPREPWHDIHCRLEGTVAWDVLYNFEQRWMKQADEQYLVPKTTLHNIVLHPLSPAAALDSPESWTVQLFRSIDDGAALGFPLAPNAAVSLGLVNVKGNIVDRSIQDAYIHAIRRAKDFVYIENQYFLGSSFDWKRSGDINMKEVGALHLIPKELSLKIVSKIEAGERFSVYVVIPMWPEGVPESASVQAILDWQRRTMEMMYTDISKAIQRKGTSETSNPRDYLSFFCLGNRESEITDEYKPEEKPKPGSDYSNAQQARRFMVYVHSKLMIVDDEYIIIGSANINQRSMDGARDTEIAMGAYQPGHLAATEPARGQIYGFRMALWYEHLHLVEDLFETPQSLLCIRRVNALAEQNWKSYMDNSIVPDMSGHLLPYPVKISGSGEVTALEENRNFPDTKAPVLGARIAYLPYVLTT
ncbi:hypothetical protein SAY87_030294 [Trapa incisa]|uniref:Phospholipase D n=1 Tax=Trapa incisa TaxID=236973 RepID=A0AAN7KVD6_9MYRT|nr:hypothetical protein SAY87_030294 [Trapa incisa]